jgi:hypothetical protein
MKYILIRCFLNHILVRVETDGVILVDLRQETVEVLAQVRGRGLLVFGWDV